MLAFGFEEETGGVRGADKIAEGLESAWGRDGFALILDEGGMGLMTVGEYVYARPGVAEKGYMDAMLILETSGGYSSRPPAHSGIGIMAEMKLPLSSTCEQISSEHLGRLFITLASTPALTICI